MSVDKKISYEKDKPAIQGGVENYLGRQPEVQAPRKWKSSPDKPETELAYITKAEKDLILKANIHGGLEKGPNMGPAGIMSLDSFGDIGGAGAAGVDTEATGGAMEGRGFSGRGPNETKSAFDARKRNQREILQKAEQRQAERLGYRERRNISDFKAKKGLGGFGKSILGGLLSLINPALGFFMRGVDFFGDKLQGLRGYNPDGSPRTQAEYEAARQARINQKRIDNILNRKAPITEATLSTLGNLGYTGDMPAVGSTPTSRAIARDIELNPEMPQFATSYLQSLAQPKVNTVVPEAKPSIKEGIETIDIGVGDPAFENALMAKLATNSPALAQYRSLQKKQRLSDFGGPEFTTDDQQKLNQLEEMEADPVNVYSQTV